MDEELCGRRNPNDDPRHTCSVPADQAHNVCSWGPGLTYWWNEGGEERFRADVAAAKKLEADRMASRQTAAPLRVGREGHN